MIGLMDCNNFFVSCERLFRPDLRDKPVAVLSSNDGCIVARSEEVKNLGIPMGIPYFKVRDICEEQNITLFSSNFPLYRDISDRVMKILRSEVSNCEIYSVDEAFFEIYKDDDIATVKALRDRIVQCTGIPIAIGVARTKTLAKVAARYAKRGKGVYILDDVTWKEKQSEVTCGSIWGIGRQTTDKLRQANIKTVKEFLLTDRAYIKEHFGVVGERMFLELSGISVSELGEGRDAEHKSLMSTRSFKNTITDRTLIESAIGHHVAHVAEKLREQKWAAGHVRVIAAPSRHGDYALRKSSSDSQLTEPTSDTQILLREALRLFDLFYDPEVPYKKAGIVVSSIVPEVLVSQSLFNDNEGDMTTLLQTTDELNQKFGSGTVRPGTVMRRHEWDSSKRLRSSEYTTKWSEIRNVKAI